MQVIEASTLNVDLDPRLKILKVTEPAARQEGIKVTSVDELLDKLQNEVKVI